MYKTVKITSGLGEGLTGKIIHEPEGDALFYTIRLDEPFKYGCDTVSTLFKVKDNIEITSYVEEHQVRPMQEYIDEYNKYKKHPQSDMVTVWLEDHYTKGLGLDKDSEGYETLEVTAWHDTVTFLTNLETGENDEAIELDKEEVKTLARFLLGWLVTH